MSGPAVGRPRTRTTPLVGGLRRVVRRHRRLVSAGLLAAAAGVAVDAAAADPPPGVHVVVAARDLPTGHRISATDLATTTVPAEAVPDGVLAAGEGVDQVLGSPVRRGEVVTDARLGGPASLTGAPAGTVAVSVPLSDPGGVRLVRPGDAVSVIAGSVAGDGFGGAADTEGAAVLVDRAVVLAVPQATGGGLLADADRSSALVLAVRTQEAVRIADSIDRRWLGVAVLP